MSFLYYFYQIKTNLRCYNICSGSVYYIYFKMLAEITMSIGHMVRNHHSLDVMKFSKLKHKVEPNKTFLPNPCSCCWTIWKECDPYIFHYKKNVCFSSCQVKPVLSDLTCNKTEFWTTQSKLNARSCSG